MDKKDKFELAKILVSVGELYSRKISDGMIDIYFTALEKFTIEQINNAMSSHTQSTKGGMFFPLPAHIILQLEGDDDGIAIAAWGTVRKAMMKIGSYESVVFADPVIMICVDRMGGWIELCNMLEKEVGYKEAEFVKMYKRFKNFPEQAPKKLIGRHEASNRLSEYSEDIPKPVLVGVEQKQLKEKL